MFFAIELFLILLLLLQISKNIYIFVNASILNIKRIAGEEGDLYIVKNEIGREIWL